MPEGGAGDLIRSARRAAGLTVEKLAELIGRDKSHLSRVEAGTRVAAEDMVEAIAEHVGVPAASILIADGRLPSAVTATLASGSLERALAAPVLNDISVPQLRRVHLAALAESHIERTYGTSAEAPRVARLVQDLKISVAQVAAGGLVEVDDCRYSIGPDIPRDHHALVLAHLAGHALLEHRGCHLTGFAPEEYEATTMATFLLAPRAALRTTALRLRNELKLEAWADVSDLITLTAERFTLPMWAMCRRLAEDGLLAEMAEVPEL
jgi:transcriptional regulator with XRE-family HTH domain